MVMVMMIMMMIMVMVMIMMMAMIVGTSWAALCRELIAEIHVFRNSLLLVRA